MSNVKMGISAQTIINRQDYGVKYGNKLPDGTLALSDVVKIDLQLEAGMKKQAETVKQKASLNRTKISRASANTIEQSYSPTLC